MKAVIEPHRTSYDEIPYPATAYQQSHVARLETLATLFGIAPADIRPSRVLELASVHKCLRIRDLCEELGFLLVRA
jgi:hypothetical protein